jgi:hypothetical protein
MGFLAGAKLDSIGFAGIAFSLWSKAASSKFSPSQTLLIGMWVP